MVIERKGSFLILAACFLWGVDLLVRYPVTLKLSFEVIVLAESFTGLIFTAPYLLRHCRELRYLSSGDWMLATFIGGVGMSIAGYLQTACIQRATPGLFSFFQIFQPVFVLYLAHKVLKELIYSIYVYWGAWIILSAVLMFSVDLSLMFSSEIIFTDIFIALTTVMIWGMCTIFAKLFLRRHSPSLLVSLRCLFAFLFSLALLFLGGHDFKIQEFFIEDYPFRFLYMGGMAGVISMALYYRGLKWIDAGKVSVLEVSYAAFGMILSALYTFESLNALQSIGAFSFFAFLFLFLSRQEFLRAAKSTR
jgi:drug/metabolite transporter (DMT)-like permease